MGWRRRTYVGEKTATSIHTDDDDDDDDDEDDASWAQTSIDLLLVDGGRQRKTINVSVSWKCEIFRCKLLWYLIELIARYITNAHTHDTRYARIY